MMICSKVAECSLFRKLEGIPGCAHGKPHRVQDEPWHEFRCDDRTGFQSCPYSQSVCVAKTES